MNCFCLTISVLRTRSNVTEAHLGNTIRAQINMVYWKYLIKSILVSGNMYIELAPPPPPYIDISQL